MAAGTFKIYVKAKRAMLRGLIDLDTDTLLAHLHKSTSNAISTSNISLYSSINNVVNATGYTGSKTVGHPTSTVRTSGAAAVFDLSNFLWTATGGNITSIQFLVIQATEYALCWCSLSSTQFNVTDTNTLTIQIAAAGVFTLT